MASCMLRMYTETSCVDLSIFSKYTANPGKTKEIPQEGRLVDRLRVRHSHQRPPLFQWGQLNAATPNAEQAAIDTAFRNGFVEQSRLHTCRSFP
jgi:hypothetical protein